MTWRLPSIVVFTLLVGSMWLHGVASVSIDDRDMSGMSGMGMMSCLELCLESMHLDGENEGSVVSPASVFHSREIETIVWPEIAQATLTTRESHHDPGRILTVVKRE